MVQVLMEADLEQKESIFILLPEIEEKVEKIEERIKKTKKGPKETKKGLISKRYSKYHEGLVCINKLKKTLDANKYRAGLYNIR